jgi:hypothetical protein
MVSGAGKLRSIHVFEFTPDIHQLTLPACEREASGSTQLSYYHTQTVPKNAQ